MGACGLEPPLGSATRGLSSSDSCEKEHCLVVKVTETQDNNIILRLLLYIYIFVLLVWIAF